MLEVLAFCSIRIRRSIFSGTSLAAKLDPTQPSLRELSFHINTFSCDTPQPCLLSGWRVSAIWRLRSSMPLRNPQMWRKALALLLLVVLALQTVHVDAHRKGGAKRRHVKAVARHLAKQLVKVQQHTTKHSAKISSTMSYSAAVGFCGEKIKAATAAAPEGEGRVLAACAMGCMWRVEHQ
jgi:hypothetical protein